MNNLPQLLEALESLQQVIRESPEVVECLRLMKECKSEVVLTPIKVDRLIGQKEAADILGVSPNRICEYVNSGLLTAYYTPPTSHRKFWLSQVLSVPFPSPKFPSPNYILSS